MKSLIETCSQTRWLILLCALLLGFNVLLAQFMPKEHALDLQFAYSPSQAYESLSQLDDEARSQYAWAIKAFDMPYLVTYALFFIGLLYRLGWKNRNWVIPILVAIFDLFENLSILYLLRIFPEKSESVGLTASFSSTAKWIFVAILLSLVVIGIFRKLLNGKKSSIDAIKA